MRTWMRDARKVYGMTQEQVAKKVGIGRVYYTNIENGKRGVDIGVMLLTAIATALGMSAEQARQAETEFKASTERAE